MKSIEELIDDIIELAEEGVLYTPDYFKDKYKMDEQLNQSKDNKAEILRRFEELEKELLKYTKAFSTLWNCYKELDKERISLSIQVSQAEEQVENAKKDKDEAVKSVRIQYDSVCDMFHKREREYEDRITDLNNALINQLETGKQKTIYINQLEKENESLRCCGNCGLSRYDNDYGLSCSYNFKKVKPNDRYCDNWQSDGLTAKDRKE